MKSAPSTQPGLDTTNVSLTESDEGIPESETNAFLPSGRSLRSGVERIEAVRSRETLPPTTRHVTSTHANASSRAPKRLLGLAAVGFGVTIAMLTVAMLSFAGQRLAIAAATERLPLIGQATQMNAPAAPMPASGLATGGATTPPAPPCRRWQAQPTRQAAGTR